MKVTETALPGVLLLEPEVFADARGLFFESWNAGRFEQATGLAPGFVQDNHSRSRRGVLRGLHYQAGMPQGKLVRVACGEIFDVAVDLRRGSPHFGRWTGVHLSGENHRQLWVPPGFAHGFLVLSGQADVLYKTTAHYDPVLERTLLWNDADVAVDWPLAGSAPLLSERDARGLPLADCEAWAPLR